MRWFHCDKCLHDLLVHPKDFIQDCPVCGGPMSVCSVDDILVEEYEMQKLNEVRSRNPNSSTIIEVVSRNTDQQIVESSTTFGGGSYETDEQKRTRLQDTGSNPV